MSPWFAGTATTALYKCDADVCSEAVEVDEPKASTGKAELPAPWRRFSIAGWVGNFVACSDACEARVRRNP